MCCALQAASVTTAQYDLARSAATTTETVLTQANVARLAKLGTFAVDGDVYAQPLIVGGVSIGGATNVAIIVTMNDSVYAFNADHPELSYIWTASLGTPTTDYPHSGSTGDLYDRNLGCLSTPVIDSALIYVVCRDVDEWYLNCLNLADGTAAKTRVLIAGANGGKTFVGKPHLQRPALLLSGGTVYVSFGSSADLQTWYGWVFSYAASDLSQIAVKLMSTTRAGIWMGSGGPVADSSGNIYVATGNGTWDGTTNFASSLLKLNPSTLAVSDYLTPANFVQIGVNTDLDFGASRPILYGDQYLLVSCKDGRMWITDKASLGHLQGTDAGPLQVWQIDPMQPATFDGNFGGMASANGAFYISLRAGKIYRFAYTGTPGTPFNQTETATTSATFAHPGAMLTYSSNGSTSGTDLLWAVTVDTDPVNPTTGALRAFNATTMAQIFTSTTKASNALGLLSKFSNPTVVNGKVYVSTMSGQVSVYGLAPATQMRGATSLRGVAKGR